MFVRDVGHGDAILLLHGTPSPAADWAPLVDVLSAKYRVLVPDLPGYGASPPPSDASLAAVGDELARMLTEKDAPTLRAIVGYSTGTWRALDLVLRTKIRANLVIALAGTATLDDAGRQFRRQLGERLLSDPDYLRSPDVAEMMCQLMLSPAWRAAHPADESRVSRWPELTTASSLGAELLALANMRDLLPELGSLDARVYARVGALDVGCPPACSEDIVRHSPRSTLDIVPACGHAILIEDRVATATVLHAQIEQG